MLDRQRIVTYGITSTAVATVALALWLAPWKSGSLIETATQPVAHGGHKVDVVFAVDTTGSMGDLIDGAKRTVWSIATHVKQLDPQADVRIGLVAYRDLGDEYVTKDFALTSDLDAVFTELSSYRAEGGGDIPEDVDAALFDAVHKMQWRSDANKMIFLVGDAPPASRGDVPAYAVSAREAGAMQIKLNTIRCGDSSDTATTWQQIASLGHGEFSSIAENGGVHQIATPYDAKMAALSDKIDSTAVIYGDEAVHRGYASKMAATAAAPAPAKADRASYFAKGSGPRTAADITESIASGDVALDGLDDNKLPEGMRGKSKEEIRADIQTRVAARQAAQAELAKVAKQRDEFLRSHAAASGGAAGFDDQVKATVEHEMK